MSDKIIRPPILIVICIWITLPKVPSVLLSIDWQECLLIWKFWLCSTIMILHYVIVLQVNRIYIVNNYASILIVWGLRMYSILMFVEQQNLVHNIVKTLSVSLFNSVIIILILLHFPFTFYKTLALPLPIAMQFTVFFLYRLGNGFLSKQWERMFQAGGFYWFWIYSDRYLLLKIINKHWFCFLTFRFKM